MLCQQGAAQKAMRDLGQDSWPDLAKRTFYSIECHAPYINCGGLAQVNLCSGKAGHLLVGDQQVYCASLVCLGFYASLSFSYNSNKTVLISNYWFYLSSPLDRERGSECIVLSCQLALNHNIQVEKPESSGFWKSFEYMRHYKIFQWLSKFI